MGSRVALRMHKEGYAIVVADKATPEKRGASFPQDIEFRLGDLRGYKNALSAIQNVDYILHLAANIGPLTYMHEHQAEIMQENSAIDASLYQAIIDKGGIKAIVYSSSSMVFQHAPRYPYSEEDLANINPPSNVYGFSKLAGEYFCKSFHSQYGLPYVILRYHNIYGPGEDSKGSSSGDIHVIPALIEKVLRGQYPIKLLGDPESTRPFTYVDDAVTATCEVVKRAMKGDPKVLNNDFNIGTGEATRIVELAKKIWEMLGDGRPFQYEVEPTIAITAVRREMDARKTERILGWKAEFPLEQGVKITADWVRDKMRK